MADGYLEKHQADYEVRKQEYLRKKREVRMASETRRRGLVRQQLTRPRLYLLR